MKFIFILAVALFFTLVALAQDVKISEASVSVADCKRIVKHDATYKPGVDVHGKPVSRADVSGADVSTDGAALKLPDEIVIDFGFDLAGRYGFEGVGLHTATAGILTIQYDLALGGLTVNGKRLNKADSRAATKACTMVLRDAAGGQ